MKPVRISEDVVPVGKLKSTVSRVLRELGESRDAVIITVNGKPAGVLISPADFDRMQERDRFMEAVVEGRRDASGGRTHADAEISKLVEERYGKR